MAFTLNSFAPLSAMANSNAPRMFVYSTDDAVASVVAADYFIDRINQLLVNDVILVVSSASGTPALTFTYVNANDGITIDCVDGLLIPATDT
jgi:hypothetical protein